MSFESDRASIEKNIREARKIVEEGKALERLQANKDFKLIVIDGYFREEAVRLVHRKSLPDMQTPYSQAAIISAIDAIGNLSAHFLSIQAAMERAQKAISAGEEELDDIAKEEAAE